MSDVTLYTVPSCGSCVASKSALKREGIEFKEVDLSLDTDALDYVRGLGYNSAPVVVAGDQHWSGFRNEKIKELSAGLSGGCPI